MKGVCNRLLQVLPTSFDYFLYTMRILFRGFCGVASERLEGATAHQDEIGLASDKEPAGGRHAARAFDVDREEHLLRRVAIGELASAFAMASAMLGFSATAMMQSISTRQRFFFARRQLKSVRMSGDRPLRPGTLRPSGTSGHQW